MPSSTHDYERLVQLGKQQGGLRIDDLQRVLDVERLSVDELSDMLIRLEAAGVSVEIDPEMLAPESRVARPTERLDTSLLERGESPLRVATARPRATHPLPVVAEPASAVRRSPFGYVRDKTVQIAVAGALGIILLLALLLASTGQR